MTSDAYNLGFQESRLDILPGLMPLAYVEGRLDAKKATNKPTKPGHTWVEDKTVKGGGYWRKLPKGSKGASTTAVGGNAAAGMAIGAAAAAGIAAMALNSRKQGNEPTPVSPALPPQPDAEKKFPTKAAIAGAAAVGAAGVGAYAYHKSRNQQPPQEPGDVDEHAFPSKGELWRKASAVSVDPQGKQTYETEVKGKKYLLEETYPDNPDPNIDNPWGDGHGSGDWTKSPHAKPADIDFEDIEPAQNPWDAKKIEKYPFPSAEELWNNADEVLKRSPNASTDYSFVSDVGGEKYAIEREEKHYSLASKKPLDYDIAQVMGMEDKVIPTKSFAMAGEDGIFIASPFIKGEPLNIESRRRKAEIKAEAEKQDNDLRTKLVENNSRFTAKEISKEEYELQREKIRSQREELSAKTASSILADNQKEIPGKIQSIPKEELIKTCLFDYVSANTRKPEDVILTPSGRKLKSGTKSDFYGLENPAQLDKNHQYIVHGNIIADSFKREDVENILRQQKNIEHLIKKHLKSDKEKTRFLEDHQKRMEKLQSMLDSGDLRVVNLLKPPSKKDSLAYKQGRLDARIGKRPEKLKCKPGFKQRGAACQPITSAKSKAIIPGKNRKAGGALAGTLALIGAAAAGTAAASLYNKNRQQPATPPAPLPPIIQKSLSKRGLIAAGAGGATLGAIATVTVVHKQRQQAVDEANAAARKEVENVQAASKKELETATNKLKAKHQEELNFANERITKTESKLKEKETQLKSYQDEAVKTKGELDGAKAAAEVLRSQLESTNSELQKHQANLEQLSSEAEQAKTASRKYQSELDKTRKQLSEQTKASEDKDEVIKQTAETAAKQQQELEKANQTVKQLTDKSKELDSQVKALHSEVESARSERDKAASDLSELRKNIESRISEGVNTERRRLEEEQSRKIGEIDAKHADRAAQAIAIAQRDFEQRLEAAQDPKPSEGFQKGRGDLIHNEEGIKLGASTRAGSDFLSRLTEDQHNKLANYANKTVENLYTGKLAAVQHSFTDSVKNIDKAFPNKVDDVSNRNLGYQGNSNAAATTRAANAVARTAKEVEEVYKNQYEKQSTIPKEGARRGAQKPVVETDKQRETRVKEQLVKLGHLETLTTQQRLRESVLQYAQKRTQEQARELYRSALENLHESAKDEFGNYTPSRVTPEALKKFDDTAKAIQAKVKKDADDDANRVLSADFGKILAEKMNEHVEEKMTDADIEEMLVNQLLGGQKRLPGSGRSKKNDSVHYLAGRLELQLNLRRHRA